MSYTAEDYITFIETGRRDKVSPEGLRLIAEKFRKLEELSDFVSKLNSLTTTELINEFPGTFHYPTPQKTVKESANQFIANDAIIWRLVKDKNKEIL